MEATIAHIAESLQALLTTQADALGRRSGFIKRLRKLSGSQFAQTLVFGWLANPQSSMEEMSQSAANVGVEISRQAVNERFTPQAAGFMQALLQAGVGCVIRGSRVDTPLLSGFEGVYVMDSTVLRLPDGLADVWKGCRGSGLKISLCWELVQGGWEEIHLQPAHQHDQQAPFALHRLPAGALVIRDLGYFKLKTYRQLSEAGVYWLSRYKGGTTVRLAGQVLDLPVWLQHQGNALIDVTVEVGNDERLPVRLIAQTVPPEVLAQRQQALQEWERKQQKSAAPQRWHLLAWSIYLTNAPSERLPAQAGECFIRLRWQIEKVFDLWKNEAFLDEWRTSNPWRILCEIYAKLLALLIAHWLMLIAQTHDVRRSALQASRTIRKHAWHLAFILDDLCTLRRVIAHLGRCLRAGCWISSSSSSPPTFQAFYA